MPGSPLISAHELHDLLESGRDTSIELQAQISQNLNTLSREHQEEMERRAQAVVGCEQVVRHHTAREKLRREQREVDRQILRGTWIEHH